jgi:predicted nucleic acid-binding protein
VNKVLLDSDVVLDFVLERKPFDIEAGEIFRLLGADKFIGYVADITVINVYYIGRKIKGREDALDTIEKLLQILEICVAEKRLLQKSLKSQITDYEDAVQHACAEAENLDAIITRNLADYKNATITVYSPTEFLNLLKSP